MKKQRPFHPLLFAAFPVLSLFAVNLDYVGFADVWRPLLVMVAVAGLMWFVAFRITKDAAKSAAGVSLFLIVMFAIGYFKTGIEDGMGQYLYALLSLPTAVIAALLLKRFVKAEKWRTITTVGFFIVLAGLFSFVLMKMNLPERHLIRLGWLYLAVIAGVLGLRIKSGIEQTTTLLNVIGIILVVQPVISFGMSSFGSSSSDSVEVSESASESQIDKSLPDIYYFVMDGYGREDVLAEMYDLPQEALTAGLRERGFYVADESRANYTQTLLSIGSSLNMNYVQALSDVDPENESREELKDLTNRNRVADLLKSHGYQYIAIVTQTELLPTKSANATMEDSHGRSLLEEAVIAKTPFGGTRVFTSGANSHRQRILGLYENLDSLKKSNRPRFVIVHVVSPHPPFVFNADGSEKPGGSAIQDGSHYMEDGGTQEAYVEGYREQAKYIAERTLQSIDLILKNSEIRPIIIVQGDHGPKSQLDYESLEKTNLNECLPILNAYLVPPEIEDDLYPSVSPVNSFNILFRNMFDTKSEPLSDKSYYSTWTLPYDFTEVEPD